jgi:hypothetical protein
LGESKARRSSWLLRRPCCSRQAADPASRRRGHSMARLECPYRLPRCPGRKYMPPRFQRNSSRARRCKSRPSRRGHDCTVRRELRTHSRSVARRRRFRRPGPGPRRTLRWVLPDSGRTTQ